MATKDTLTKLGFDEKEAKLYLTLLRRGKMKYSELAKAAGIHRTSVYHLANNLISKGVVTEDESGKVTELVPLPPENLENILQEDRRELERKEVLVSQAVDELERISADKEYPVPKLKFVEENDVEKYLYNNTEKWQRSIQDLGVEWWGFQDHSFAEVFDDWLRWTWTTKTEKQYRQNHRLFSNPSEIEQKLEKQTPSRRVIRPLQNVNFTATTWVCGEYIIVIHTRDKPFYLYEIHDQKLAHNMREVLKTLWETNAE